MIDDAKALQLSRDAYTGSTTYFDANIRNDLERDIRQFQSKHSSDSKYMAESYRARSRFYRPKASSVRRMASAPPATLRGVSTSSTRTSHLPPCVRASR